MKHLKPTLLKMQKVIHHSSGETFNSNVIPAQVGRQCNSGVEALFNIPKQSKTIP